MSVPLPWGEGPTGGRPAFPALMQELRSEIESAQREAAQIVPTHTATEGAVGKFFHDHDDSLSHYYRTVTATLELLDHAEGEDAALYGSLFRAQFSTAELVALWYLCSQGGRVARLRALLDRHNVLDRLTADSILERAHASMWSAPLDRQWSEVQAN